SVREVTPGTTPLAVAASIGPRLARDAVGAEVEGRRVDLRQPLASGGSFRIFTAKSPEAGEFLRHSAEHVLADAVKRLWPELKLERLAEIPEGEPITLFRHGRFVDLCRGPHAQRTSQIGAVKLLESSGSFWKGDETGERLQRIYGTAFATPEELDAYLARLEE